MNLNIALIIFGTAVLKSVIANPVLPAGWLALRFQSEPPTKTKLSMILSRRFRKVVTQGFAVLLCASRLVTFAVSALPALRSWQIDKVDQSAAEFALAQNCCSAILAKCCNLQHETPCDRGKI